MKHVLETVKSVAIALLIAIFTVTFIFQIVSVNGESMVPTLQSDDRLVLEKVSYKISTPKINDIVVIRYPSDTRQRFIKRIIAIQGDRVKIQDNKLYVNGKTINEYYINENTMKDYDEVMVPKDTIFVLGDNRNFSKDSRSSDVGFVKLNLVDGRAIIRLYPFNKMGRIR